MQAETMAALKKAHKNIVGVKDATGRIEHVAEQRFKCGDDFIQLSGEDASAIGFNAQGGQGCISVTSNVAPSLCAQIQIACEKGEYAKALALNDRLIPLHKALFLEPSPVGVKYALHCMGKILPIARLPLVPLQEETKKKIDSALNYAGLL